MIHVQVRTVQALGDGQREFLHGNGLGGAEGQVVGIQLHQTGVDDRLDLGLGLIGHAVLGGGDDVLGQDRAVVGGVAQVTGGGLVLGDVQGMHVSQREQVVQQDSRLRAGEGFALGDAARDQGHEQHQGHQQGKEPLHGSRPPRRLCGNSG